MDKIARRRATSDKTDVDGQRASTSSIRLPARRTARGCRLGGMALSTATPPSRRFMTACDGRDAAITVKGLSPLPARPTRTNVAHHGLGSDRPRVLCRRALPRRALHESRHRTHRVRRQPLGRRTTSTASTTTSGSASALSQPPTSTTPSRPRGTGIDSKLHVHNPGCHHNEGPMPHRARQGRRCPGGPARSPPPDLGGIAVRPIRD